MMRHLRLQLATDIKRLQPLLTSTVAFSVVLSLALHAPFVIEPTVAFVGAALTLIVVDLHSTNFTIRLFSCDGRYGQIRTISAFIATLLLAIFSVFTISGFLNLVGIYISANQMLRVALFVTLLHSVTFLGTFFITVFFPTFMLGLFAAAEVSFIVSGGREAFFEAVVGLHLPPVCLALPLLALTTTTLELRQFRYGLVGDLSGIIKGNKILALSLRSVISIIRHYFVFVPLLFVPSIYLFYSDHGVEFVFVLSAIVVTFLLLSVSFKNLEMLRIVGLGWLFTASTATVTVAVLVLNSVSTFADIEMIVSIVAACLVANVMAVAYRFRQKTIKFGFAIVGLLMVSFIYSYEYYALIPALIYVYTFVRCS